MYYVTKIQPQVADTNMQGHVDFLAYSRWFDRARTTLYEELLPGFHTKPHGLVIVNVTVDFLRETFVDDRVEIRTWTSRIGEKSFELTQELWRVRDDAPNLERCAVTKVVLCAINFDVHKSEPLSGHFRNVLAKYTAPEPEYEAVAAMKRMSQSAREAGVADMTLDEINAEIAAARREIDKKQA